MGWLNKLNKEARYTDEELIYKGPIPEVPDRVWRKSGEINGLGG